MTETSSNVSKPRSKARRLSHTISSSNTIRDTLSAFGDDVIKIKDPNNIPQGITGGYMPQEGINPSEVSFSKDFDMLGHPSQQGLKFERVPSSEVGIRSSRWTKVILAGFFSSKMSSKKRKGTIVEEEGEVGDGDFRKEENTERRPPFWGVSEANRDKVPTLSLQLILHEIACFASCVLFGCLIVQALEGFSWIKQGNIQENWLFSRLYGSFTTILLVFTSIGFLLRVDTTDKGSILTLPLFLLPAILLSISDYLNKAWELQRQECLNYFKMNENLRSKVHLTQDCSFYKITEQTRPESAVVIVMRILPAVACLIIAIYMFICRDTFYMIGRFSKKINKL